MTLVDGDRVYAFGHPFFASGRTEMPMLSAEVLYTLPDQFDARKLTMVGEERGAIVEDRLTAIVGRTGSTAAMIPVQMTVSGGAYEPRTFDYEIIRNSRLVPLLAATTVANSLVANLGYDAETTMSGPRKGSARGWDRPAVRDGIRRQERNQPRHSDRYPAGGATGPSLEQPLSARCDSTASIWEVTVAPEVRSYRVDSLVYDRGPVRPGQELKIRCLLARYREGTVSKS